MGLRVGGLDSLSELPGQDTEPFSTYLAKLLVAQQGYQLGAVPEAQRLAGASDIILTKTDGSGFWILCIVDASADPAKRFRLDRTTVVEIAKLCRKTYSPRFNHARMPAFVDIVEIRNQVTRDDIARLKPLKSRFYRLVTTYAVDLSSRTVTRNIGPFRNSRQSLIERALRQPRLSGDALVPVTPAALPETRRWPVLTLAMLAVLAAIFALEVNFPAEGGKPALEPSITTLIAFGGLMRDLVVKHGEWFRLFTGPLLHANLEHIIFNGIAFWFAGSVLERLLGRAWLLVLFFFGALGGAGMSMLINPPEMVSIGASGAIMCLIAAAYVTSFRYPRGLMRTSVQARMLRMLIPSLLPLAFAGSGGGQVDYAAHFGGALTGFALSGILLRIWPRDVSAPRFAPLAQALAALSIVVFAGAGYEVAGVHDVYAIGAYLIPDDELPKTDEQLAASSKHLVEAYPKDPRAHFYRALATMDDDPVTSERELRAALAEHQVLEIEFKPEFEFTLVSYLAKTLVAEGRGDEARLEVKPYCHKGANGSVPESLQALGLCTGQ